MPGHPNPTMARHGGDPRQHHGGRSVGRRGIKATLVPAAMGRDGQGGSPAARGHQPPPGFHSSPCDARKPATARLPAGQPPRRNRAPRPGMQKPTAQAAVAAVPPPKALPPAPHAFQPHRIPVRAPPASGTGPCSGHHRPPCRPTSLSRPSPSLLPPYAKQLRRSSAAAPRCATPCPAVLCSRQPR